MAIGPIGNVKKIIILRLAEEYGKAVHGTTVDNTVQAYAGFIS